MATLFRADFNGALTDVSGNGIDIIKGGKGSIQDGAYFLNGKAEAEGGNSLSLERDASFFSQRKIDYALDFKAASAGEGGSLFRIHNAVQIDVTDKGEVVFKLLGNAAGQKGTITSKPLGLTDAKWHSVTLSYDADAGKMTGFVDGKSVGSIKVSGATKAAEYWDPMVGTPWGGGFRGYVDNVSISGKPLNRAPVGGADEFTMREDGTLKVKNTQLLANDSDPEGGKLAVVSAKLVEGKGKVDVSGKELTYAPTKDWSGQAVIHYTLQDADGSKVVVPITVTVEANKAPTGGADTFTTAEDKAIKVKLTDLLANDTDADGTKLSISAAKLIEGSGKVALTGKELAFTPTKDWSGKAVVEYTLQDADGAKVAVPVTINVTPEARVPAGSSSGGTTHPSSSGDVRQLMAEASRHFDKAILVNSSKEFLSALENAKGGETILLRGDVDYAGVVKGMKAHKEMVTVTSLDPNDPANITGLDLRKASNVTFDNLHFEYAGRVGKFQTDIVVSDSSNVTFSNSTFKGLAAGYVPVGGQVAQSFMNVTNTKGFTFENNDVSNYYMGLGVGKSSDVKVVGNDFHGMQGDGMRYYELKGVLIENNWFHDFLGVDQSITHNDYIQFWTTNTKTGSQDVVIRGNLLARGEYGSQSIFVNDQLGDNGNGGATRYKNFLVEDNFINNSHYHGITVGRADGVVIRDNTLPTMANAGVNSKMVSSINVMNSTGVQVYDNLTPKTTSEASKLVRADGNAPVSSLVATIAAEYEGNRTYTMDGRYSAQADGKWMTSSNATFRWDFGDGTSAEGIKVSHQYADASNHTVMLTVLGKDGSTDTAKLIASSNATVDQPHDANGSMAFLHHSDPWGV